MPILKSKKSNISINFIMYKYNYSILKIIIKKNSNLIAQLYIKFNKIKVIYYIIIKHI